VTELDAATGAPVRVLTPFGSGLNDPQAIADGGSRVWVTNAGDDSVTEFPASQ
jgi:hypothetical protein